MYVLYDTFPEKVETPANVPAPVWSLRESPDTIRPKTRRSLDLEGESIVGANRGGRGRASSLNLALAPRLARELIPVAKKIMNDRVAKQRRLELDFPAFHCSCRQSSQQ